MLKTLFKSAVTKIKHAYQLHEFVTNQDAEDRADDQRFQDKIHQLDQEFRLKHGYDMDSPEADDFCCNSEIAGRADYEAQQEHPSKHVLHELIAKQCIFANDLATKSTKTGKTPEQILEQFTPDDDDTFAGMHREIRQNAKVLHDMIASSHQDGLLVP